MDLRLAADAMLSLSHGNKHRCLCSEQVRQGEGEDRSPRCKKMSTVAKCTIRVTSISQLLCTEDVQLDTRRYCASGTSNKLRASGQVLPRSMNTGHIPSTEIPVSTADSGAFCPPPDRPFSSGISQDSHLRGGNENAMCEPQFLAGSSGLPADKPQVQAIYPFTAYPSPISQEISGLDCCVPVPRGFSGLSANFSSVMSPEYHCCSLSIVTDDRPRNQSCLAIHLNSPIPAAPTGEVSQSNDILESAADTHYASSRDLSSCVKPHHRKYYTNPVPSSHCHCCARSTTARAVPFVACSRLKDGLCRKVICAKCFIRFDWNWAVALSSSSWTCTHCRGTCPERSQCFIYARVNRCRIAKSRAAKPSSRAATKADILPRNIEHNMDNLGSGRNFPSADG